MSHRFYICAIIIAALFIFSIPSYLRAQEAPGTEATARETPQAVEIISEPAEEPAAALPVTESPGEPATPPADVKDTAKTAEPPQEQSHLLILKEKMIALTGQMNATAAAADTLYNPRNSSENIQKVYTAYAKEVGSLQQNITAMLQEYGALQKNGDAYFFSWQSKLVQINNKSLQSQSRKSYTQTNKQYERIKTDMQKCIDSITPYFSDMQDVVHFLEYDLNKKSIAGSKGLLKKFSSNKTKLIKQADNVVKQLEKLAEERSF